jgi:hypothetical protein
MFASNECRKELLDSNVAFNACPFVVRFEKAGRQSELVADDIEHALELSAQWINAGANYVEVFRVLQDGSLNATIGAHGELAA